MKIQNPKPNVFLFRRSLPYVAGLSVAALTLWGLRQHPTATTTAELSRPTEVVAASPSGDLSLSESSQAAAPTPSAGGCADCAQKSPTIAQQITQIPVATQPDVEVLLKKFRKGDHLVKTNAFDSLKTATIGKAVTVQAGGIEWKGILDSRLDQSNTFQAGVTLDNDLGRLVISIRGDQKILATVFFTGENQVLTARGFPENGAWTMETSVYENVACQPKGAVYTPPAVPAKGATAATSNTRVPAANPITVPLLNSNPKSTYVVYVDFDGEVVVNPAWAGGKMIDATPMAGAQSPAFITEVWQRASEDFAPFDVNVTTDRTVYDAADPTRRVMGIATDNNTAMPGSGGVAMLGSFGQEIPFWIFNDTVGTCADTVSHEGGHTMGLMHDGTTAGVEYYGGQGSGAVSWAPIMGAYFSDGTDEEVTSWGKGEYPNANNKEDDLRIITSTNGFGYRTDDVPNTRLAAKELTVVNGNFLDSGIIERNDDVDWFKFSTRGGVFKLQISALRITGVEPMRGANLGISATLYNGAGKQLQISNINNSLDSSFSLRLAAGDYYVKVEGAGKGTPATSFTKYSSLGQYFITGSVPLKEPVSISPLANKFSPKGGEGSFNVSSEAGWSWSCSASWIQSSELKNQSGNQRFDYVVAENTAYASRVATITLTSGIFSYSHSVYQEARVPDDHGDTTASATSVDLGSATDGRINFAGDVDVFRIVVEESGYLHIGTTGVTNTYGRLMDSNGVVLASNDDGDKLNFALVHPVLAGVYYVEVSQTGLFDAGGGIYQFYNNFVPSNVITIDPTSRVVNPVAADFGFDLTSNTDWTWSIWSFDGTDWVAGCSWLTTDEALNQSMSQRFAYHLAENTSTEVRKAQIRIRKVGALIDDVTHEISQIAPGMDDCGDTIATAKPIALNSSISGMINTEGDLDVYQVDIPVVGSLTAGTTGSFDTFGTLLDANGNVLASNDDLTDVNFGFTRSLLPGRYYIQVRHFRSIDVGSYQLFVGFKNPSTVNLVYKVDRMLGALSGITTQTIKPGGNGRAVTAVAKAGYVFTGWSDGVLTATRTDLRVLSDLTVTALFSRLLSVEKDGGPSLVDNQDPPLDFGSITTAQSATVNFVIKNMGTKDLTKINVTRYGANGSDWVIAPLSKTTLKPNESIVLSATLHSSVVGSKICSLTINAIGNPLPFRINVMGTVTGVITGATADAPATQSPAATGGSDSAKSNQTSAITPRATTAASYAWADVNPNGTIQHFFSQSNSQTTPPKFWISDNGVDWVQSPIMALWEIGSSENQKEFEVLLSDMGLNALRVVVTDQPPQPNVP